MVGGNSLKIKIRKETHIHTRTPHSRNTCAHKHVAKEPNVEILMGMGSLKKKKKSPKLIDYVNAAKVQLNL